MYGAGEGVAQTHGPAAMWFHRAATPGYEPAQTALSFMCTEGRGVEQDFVQALKWIDLAGAQNAMITAMFRNHLTSV